MRRRGILAAAGLSFVSGCLRMSGDGEPETTTTGESESSDPSTITETTDDAGSSAVSEPDFPTGLSEDGVQAYLADSHTNELARTSFATEWVEANVSDGRVTQQRRYRVDEGQAIGEWTSQGAVTMFLSGDGGYWREDLGGTVTYGHHRSGYDIRELTNNEMLRILFQAGSWQEPRVAARGEDPAFEITADGIDSTATTAVKREFEAESLDSFSSSGRVRESGIVTDLDTVLEFISQDEDRLVQFEVRYGVSDIGRVSVSEPDWLSTAKSQAPEVSARLTDDERFVEMDFESGNPILPETDLVLWNEDAHNNDGYYNIRDSLESGTTYYLYLTDGQMGVSRGSPPTDVSPDPLTDRYSLWAHRNGAEYFFIQNFTV